MSEAVAGMGLPTTDTMPAAGRRFVVVAALGTLFECYGFFVFVVLATLVVAHLFPSGDDIAALLAAFAICVVGFWARPAGAILFRPLAALLAEMFPARIRVTSLSLAFQLGHGWFGSLLPLLAPAIAVMSLVVGSLFLRDKLGRDLHA